MVRKEVKEMMMRGVDKDDLVTFAFTKHQIKNELKWKHSREFEYNGNMYDIVTFRKEGDKYIYDCWLDKKETKLNAQLAALYSQKWNQVKGNYQDRTHLDHFVDSLFFDNPDTNYFLFSIENNLTYSTMNNVLDSKINRLYPPPKV